jgi:hypothetical protein
VVTIAWLSPSEFSWARFDRAITATTSAGCINDIWETNVMLLNDWQQDQGILGGAINHLANTLGVFGFSRHSPTHERGLSL